MNAAYNWKSNHEPIEKENYAPGMRMIAGIMLILTLAGAFWAGMFPIRGENDCWWHLKTGEYLWQYFLQNGFHFPPYDVFTFTGEKTPWINHEWLSDLIFFAAYSAGGLQGAIVFKSIILTITTALLILYMARNGVGWKMACLGAIIVILASHGTLFLRPPIFTYLFIVIFFHIILSFQLGEHFKLAFAAAILGEIVWINLHGGGIIGILLIFFWWLSELWFCLVTWLNENPTAPSFQRLWKSSIILLAVFLASFVNPFTYEVHLLPAKVMEDHWLLRNLGEMQSPNMHYANAFEAILLGLLLLPMLRAGSIWIYEGLAIVFFAHQALNHLRHIPLFALVAVPPLISAFAEERLALFPQTGDIKEYSRSIWGRLCLLVSWIMRHHIDVILVFILFAYVFGLRPGKIWLQNYRDFPYLAEDGYIKDRYPVNAVDFLVYYKIPGPMFNDDNFAGYLIYRLSPEIMKIFTDSRFDMWGSYYAKEKVAVYNALAVPFGVYDDHGRWTDMEWRKNQIGEFLKDHSNFPELKDWFESGKEYWEYVLDKYKINFIISYERQPLDLYLRSEFKGWYLIYDDVKVLHKSGGYVIYLRDAPENLPLIRKHAVIHREHIPE
ncbi:MAG: hypothetical protein AB1656_08490 [Candidatus Omnitrophota bacterium]